jgi:hypothetical protein
MAAGRTLTDDLADSLPTIIGLARIVREQEGVMTQVVDRETLGEGIGLTWTEISLAALTAQAIQETTVLDNPQKLSDTLFSITPTVIGIQTLITDRVSARISKNVLAKTGVLAQNAIERKKDQDGLTVLDGATTSLGGTGTTGTSGHISAAVNRILGNTTEPGKMPIHLVAHPFQIKDIQDEIVAGIGTYNIPEGTTARVFTQGFSGMLFGAAVFPDGNITIDSTPDAKGGIFAQDAIVLVQGRSPYIRMRDEPHIGGGAVSLFHYDEYAFGERSPGNWLYEWFTDGTAPTS